VTATGLQVTRERHGSRACRRSRARLGPISGVCSREEPKYRRCRNAAREHGNQGVSIPDFAYAHRAGDRRGHRPGDGAVGSVVTIVPAWQERSLSGHSMATHALLTVMQVEDLNVEPLTDAGQAGMVGQVLIEGTARYQRWARMRLAVSMRCRYAGEMSTPT
jgi:hypothetical protein